MLECEIWYDLSGPRQQLQRFTLPREDLAALRHAVQAVRRRNPAFHIRLRRLDVGTEAANPRRARPAA